MNSEFDSRVHGQPSIFCSFTRHFSAFECDLLLNPRVILQVVTLKPLVLGHGQTGLSVMAQRLTFPFPFVHHQPRHFLKKSLTVETRTPVRPADVEISYAGHVLRFTFLFIPDFLDHHSQDSAVPNSLSINSWRCHSNYE